MLPEVESLGVQSSWLLKTALPSTEESDISLSNMNSKARFQPARYARIISPKGGSALNTRSNDFIRSI